MAGRPVLFRGFGVRIVHVITGLGTGGAEIMLYRLLSVWDRGRDQIEVISLTDRGIIADRIEKLGVPVRELGMPRGRPSLAGLLRLGSWLRQRSPHLVHCWMYHANLVGGLAAKLSGGKTVIWTIQNSTLDPKGSRRMTIWTVKAGAWASSLARKIVCCSAVARDVHIEIGFRSDRMTVIPNGCDVQDFKPDAAARVALRKELGLPTDTVLSGLVARFDPQKDHRTFVEAAGRVAAKHGDVHFVLSGDGADRTNAQLSAWIESSRVRDRFHLLGRRDDMPRITAALDIATCASAYGEASPLVLAEAMSCGVPCVVTDVGDSRLIVGDTGRTVPPKQPEKFAEALDSMLKLGVDARSQLGANARQRIQEKFDLPAIRDRYAALYREVAANGIGHSTEQG